MADWDRETAYIQDAIMKSVEERAVADAVVGGQIAEMSADRREVSTGARIDPLDLEVYACGINAMVHGLDQAVFGIGVPDRHIHCEGYG